MNSKLLLCLALVLGGGLAWLPQNVRAQEAVVNAASSTNAEQNLDSLLNAFFPGKRLQDIFAAELVDKIRRLPAKDRNRIAFAAARELSLRTTNDDLVTAETVDELLYRKPTSLKESALRKVCERDQMVVWLLRDLENLRLISDPGVIGPLIDILDFPGVKTNIRNEAAQVLGQLTGREYSNEERYLVPEKRAQFIQWWRDWWARNKNKHPVFDEEIEELIKARVAAIELQLRMDLTNYYEITRLRAEYPSITHIDPDTLVDIDVDSSMLQQGVFRTTPDGKIRAATKDDYTYLRITAEFGIPPVFQHRDGTPARWQSSKTELLREVLPGTDIAITVQAASQDHVFIDQVRRSLAKLPPTPDSVAKARQQWELVKKAEAALPILETDKVLRAVEDHN